MEYVREETLKDYGDFMKFLGETEYKCNVTDFKEVYDECTIEEINKYAKKYNVKPINEEEIDWEWCNLITGTELKIKEKIENKIKRFIY